MEFSQIGRSFGHFIRQNSTTILASTAVVGAISTGVLAAKGARIQGIDEAVGGTPDDIRDAVRKYWKLYIPAAAVGTATVVCIIGVNHVGMRRTAAVATAYGITERAFADYQAKVRTMFGEKKDQAVRDEIAKDQMNTTPLSGQAVVFGTGDHTCYDTLSGRYFKGQIEKIRRVENDINASLLHGQDSVSQNEFYLALGIPELPNGDGVGWSDENLMELIFSSHLSDDGTPCIAIGHRNLPKDEFWKAGR